MICIFILLLLSALQYSFIVLITIASLRSSQWRCPVKKVFVKFSKIYRKAHVLEPVFNKVAGLRRVYNFMKRRLKHRCFPMTFAKILRTLILKTSANDCFYSFKHSEGSSHWDHSNTLKIRFDI